MANPSLVFGWDTYLYGQPNYDGWRGPNFESPTVATLLNLKITCNNKMSSVVAPGFCASGGVVLDHHLFDMQHKDSIWYLHNIWIVFLWASVNSVVFADVPPGHRHQISVFCPASAVSCDVNTARILSVSWPQHSSWTIVRQVTKFDLPCYHAG